MDEKVLKIKTKYGNVSIRLFFRDGKIVKYTPNQDECREIAEGFNQPINKVYNELQQDVKKYLQSINT